MDWMDCLVWLKLCIVCLLSSMRWMESLIWICFGITDFQADAFSGDNKRKESGICGRSGTLGKNCNLVEIIPGILWIGVVCISEKDAKVLDSESYGCGS